MSCITDLQVSLNSDKEKKLSDEGYLSVPGNLNKGTGGNQIFLWYKKGSGKKITRIQFSFTEKMGQSLQSAEFEKIDKNLNEGTAGDKIYLWYFKGSSTYDAPIIDLHVTTHTDDETDMFGLGWERLACDLNRNAGGNRIHLWVKREKQTYICDITANMNGNGDTTMLSEAFIQVDEKINRDALGPCIFIWYRQTKDQSGAINDVKISSTEVPGYIKVEQDLNQSTGGPPIYLWYSKKARNPCIQDLTLILTEEAHEDYKKAKIPVIEKNLNPKGEPEYLCYYP